MHGYRLCAPSIPIETAGILLVLLLLLNQSINAQQAPFTRITVGSVATDGGDSTGVSWIDYDGDGYLDLFVSNFETPRFFVYHNNQDETITLEDIVITSPTDLMQAEGCVWADFDNDGDPDLFIAVGLGGNDLLYRNDGGGNFTKLTGIPPTQSGGNSRGCAWADYDNDGWVDLFVANEKGQTNFLFHNDAGAGFTRVMTGSIVTDKGNSYGCSWGDYDNDGRLDLVVANNGSRNFLYHNEGNGIFLKVTNSAIVTNIASSAGVAWGDYDNDGFLDLFVANLGQKNFLYHNNGDGTFTLNRNTAIGQEITYSWSGAWADFDNDGYLDLFVANGQPNGTGLKDFLYRNRGDGTFEKLTVGAMVNDTSCGDACAWGDYNNDGFLDLFVSNLVGQNNFLYRNNGNSNHWLMVQCEGRSSNRSAIGARLELTAEIGGAQVRQIREISGGSGYGSQNSLIQHFGLGSATNVTSLRIRWPSGIVQDFANIAADQRLDVREPSQFQSTGRIEQTMFKGEIRASGRLTYDIEFSEDFLNWSLLTSLTNAPSPVAFEDTLPTDARARFYRAKERD